MKKFLLSAAALAVAMCANAQVFQMDGEAHGLTSDLSAVEAGHVWGSIEGALDISNAFETQHKLVDCKLDDFTKVIIDGNEILTKGGVQGNDNPKDGDGSNPAVSFVPAVSGAVIQLDAKKDGWVYIVAKLSTNKQYMVFEEGLPIGYKVAIESNNEAIPGGVLSLEIKGEGEFNNLSLDQYPGGLKWLIREFTGNAEAESAGNGLGVFYFPVAKDCKYLASATGSKITWCGVYFSETEAKNVSVEGEGVFRTLINSGDTWTVAGVKPICDNSWDPSDVKAEMQTADGVTYTYTKEDIVLEKGTNYEFKIVKGHAWGEEYPSQNFSFDVDETAKYKVTITFNSETKDIEADYVKTGEAEAATHVYSVIGTINGNWDVDTDMTKGADGLYAAVFEDVKAGDYKFKVRVDHDWSVAYPGSDYALKVDNDGSTVTITFNEDSKEVKATVAAGTGIQVVKALTEVIAIYNLAGQRVDANYKGVVIVNGQKVVIR
jgi:hypothetical protein